MADLRQRFHHSGVAVFSLIWLLMSCVNTSGVEKPDPAISERGQGTTDQVQGGLLAPVLLYRQLSSLDITIKVEIREAKNCSRPTPLKNMSIVLLQSDDANESLVQQYSVEKASFVLTLKAPEGRYFVELRDERVGRTLERKVVELDSSSGPWLFIDPC